MSESNQYNLPHHTILNGRYRIETVIGQGGFGITYRAEVLKTGHNVCIKELFVAGHCTRGEENLIFTQGLKEEEFSVYVKRFLEEARALQHFSHPGIVHVRDVFEAFNTAFYVMDFIEGETLKDLVRREGRIPYVRAMRIFNDLMSAVTEVHSNGMLHRDIKPDNILIKPDGSPVLIDFGSARTLGDGKTLTQTAILTPGYAPIEQYSEKARRGPFTDVYALGASMYFALTGQKPLAVTDRQMELLKAPHQLFSDIPVTLSSAVMLALNIKPEDRFQDVPAFRQAIEQMQMPSEDNADRNQEQQKAIRSPGNNSISKKRWLWPLLISLVLLLLGYIAFIMVNNNELFPHELDTSENVIRSFYGCYDYAHEKRLRADCVGQYFSQAYQNSFDAKAIIDAYYAYKQHTLNNIRLKEEDGNRRVLTVDYDFSFRAKSYSYLKEQKGGVMEITLNAENRIDLIRFIELPKE